MSKPDCWMAPDEIMKDAVHISIRARDAGNKEAANRGHDSMLTAQICARLDRLIEVLEGSGPEEREMSEDEERKACYPNRFFDKRSEMDEYGAGQASRQRGEPLGVHLGNRVSFFALGWIDEAHYG